MADDYMKSAAISYDEIVVLRCEMTNLKNVIKAKDVKIAELSAESSHGSKLATENAALLEMVKDYEMDLVIKNESVNQWHQEAIQRRGELAQRAVELADAYAQISALEARIASVVAPAEVTKSRPAFTPRLMDRRDLVGLIG
jgi:glutamine synthetase type III